MTAKSASSASRGAQEALEREQIVVAAKLGVAAGQKRALPMRWEFTWIGWLLRAGERRDWSGQASEAENGGKF